MSGETNQNLPSGPQTSPCGLAASAGRRYVETSPVAVSTAANACPMVWVNQSRPSGPVFRSQETRSGAASGYSVIFPPVVMAPMLRPPHSVNQIRPSGPASRWYGTTVGSGTWNSVTWPVVVIAPIAPVVREEPQPAVGARRR